MILKFLLKKTEVVKSIQIDRMQTARQLQTLTDSLDLPVQNQQIFIIILICKQRIFKTFRFLINFFCLFVFLTFHKFISSVVG